MVIAVTAPINSEWYVRKRPVEERGADKEWCDSPVDHRISDFSPDKTP